MYIIVRSVLSVPGQSELSLLPFRKASEPSSALDAGNLFKASYTCKFAISRLAVCLKE